MLRSEGDREALQEIDLKQSPQEFAHAPSLFPPSPIVKQRLLSFFFTLFQRVILSPAMEIDIQFMQEALGEARAAAAGGEVPIGAVLVHDGKILARSANRTIRDNDPRSEERRVGKECRY